MHIPHFSSIQQRSPQFGRKATAQEFYDVQLFAHQQWGFEADPERTFVYKEPRLPFLGPVIPEWTWLQEWWDRKKMVKAEKEHPELSKRPHLSLYTDLTDSDLTYFGLLREEIHQSHEKFRSAIKKEVDLLHAMAAERVKACVALVPYQKMKTTSSIIAKNIIQLHQFKIKHFNDHAVLIAHGPSLKTITNQEVS